MKRPNILMIMTDQQRRDTLGAYGCDWIPTPNLDRLAASGTAFTRATVDNPICTPSRASIFTGKMVPDHSVYRVHDNLPDDEVLFTERLRLEAGYRTALFGKLHVSSRLAEERRRHPNDGFEIYEWCLEPSVGMDSRFNGYVAWLRANAPDFLATLKANKRGELHHPEAVHMSKWAADRTIDFITGAEDDDRPFFCLMSLFDPHDPYQDHPLSMRPLIDEARIPAPIARRAAPDCVRREQEGSYLGRSADFTAAEVHQIRLGYAASIAFADQQIGRVLDALDQAGLAENTLVIFMSDHGDQLGDHGLFVKGVALYEPTVGVPLLLRWPGQVPSGAQCGALAQGRDIAATCLAAAGLDTAAHCPDSEDLAAMAQRGKAARQAAICAYRNSGVDNQGQFWDPPMLSTMARNERFKLALYASDDKTEVELFDLESDPGEQHNITGDVAYADMERFLMTEIAHFLQKEIIARRPRAGSSIPDVRQRLMNKLK
ncbi:sulfatase family protein [Chelativorans alearense]|uniref:sulfatase family protein n=1 Tax=Chelativorans alearense TaxID=2681495 RepID=UPI0013D40347|nr:sulfatase-like hydrolase/transferase [Chelativorans alearense]